MSDRSRCFKMAAVLMLLAGAGTFTGSAAGLTLAEGGKTAYKVVVAPNAEKIDKEAALDLAATLKEITGADFSDAAGKSKSIFVGTAAPGDKTPLKEFERRIVTQDGNLYIYGEGDYGTNNAVYDFLRDELGCRWFTTSGDRKIPKRDKLVIGDLKKSRIPSIPFMTADRVNNRAPELLRYARRNAIVDELDNFIEHYRLHAGQRIIPSGKVPYGKRADKRIGVIFGPVKALKDKAYFKDHPEYFSMNAKGERVISLQLCYSNMEMRDEFVRNLEIMIKADNYKGGRKLLGVGQDDNGGPFCCCPNCQALVKKYNHPAGPYYDFLLDLSARFAKKYPRLMLIFLAYRSDQTLFPAECMKKLPYNLLPSYAPLGCDFLKPLNYRPTNAIQDDSFKKWADIAEQQHWWSYPTTYPRPIVSFPLTANIHRIAENFRLAHKYKTLYAYCQFGPGFYGNFGFNDLRTYLLAQLCRDITLDENKIIDEFTAGCYGKAAPLMRKYLSELEKLEVETNFYLRWNPHLLHLPYTTGANLLRWERDFDEMEKLAAGDERALLNIRRARFNLDETLIAKWPYLTPEELKAAGDLEKVIARAEKTIVDDQQDLYRELRKSDPQKYKQLVTDRVKWHHSGLDQFVARARGGKPLPAKFAKLKKVYRLLPDRNKQALDVDPDAPFGLSNKGLFRADVHSWCNLRTYDPNRQPKWAISHPPMPLGPNRTKDRLDGKYRYIFLGKMPVEHQDAMLFIGAISPSSTICLSPVYDPKRPHRLYSFALLVAFAPDKSWVKVAELVVVPTDEDAKPASDQKDAPTKLRKDTQNEFV